MNPSQILEEAKRKIDAATTHLQDDLKKLRTGRAHSGMLDSLMVEVYGQPMLLKAVASIAAPEAQLLQITPFDPGNLQAIAEAIRNDQSLGLTPTDDGRVVRINLPPMTAESRQSMVKVVGQKVEDCFVSVRQARHDAFHKLEQAEKDKTIGKDELERSKKQIDEQAAKQKTQVEELARAKEQEILTV
jgi:ribosome recycling factor